MKNRGRQDGGPQGKGNNFKSSTQQKKKNMKRLGGGGLSLEAFASMKSNHNQYNPAIIKKQREFYKNAKCVNKYKKSLKQLNLQNDPPAVPIPLQDGRADERKNFKHSENKEIGSSSRYNNKKKNKGRGSQGLQELYEKKQEEERKAKMERDAIMKAKNEEREKAQARRMAEKEKMMKRTRRGQPVMQYKIEQVLQTLQGSTRR